MENKDAHFKLVYYFIVGLSALIMIYIFSATFMAIPKDNVRYVDGAFGFLLGILSSAVMYLVGGNPNPTKKNEPDTTEITLPTGDKTTVTTENKNK